ncbi:MAG TPA: MEDS domain-containing protein [Nitrososphaera sp.]|nr:MEDS domain-containing protein [Nitrososphaera sp.]
MSKTRLAEHYPDNFVDSPRPGMHIVLFYEEPERGRKLIFRYILCGLEKEEHCCYSVSDEDPDLVKAQMIDYGIDVKHYADRKNFSTSSKFRIP